MLEISSLLHEFWVCLLICKALSILLLSELLSAAYVHMLKRWCEFLWLKHSCALAFYKRADKPVAAASVSERCLTCGMGKCFSAGLAARYMSCSVSLPVCWSCRICTARHRWVLSMPSMHAQNTLLRSVFYIRYTCWQDALPQLSTCLMSSLLHELQPVLHQHISSQANGYRLHGPSLIYAGMLRYNDAGPFPDRRSCWAILWSLCRRWPQSMLEAMAWG